MTFSPRQQELLDDDYLSLATGMVKSPNPDMSVDADEDKLSIAQKEARERDVKLQNSTAAKMAVKATESDPGYLKLMGNWGESWLKNQLVEKPAIVGSAILSGLKGLPRVAADLAVLANRGRHWLFSPITPKEIQRKNDRDDLFFGAMASTIPSMEDTYQDFQGALGKVGIDIEPKGFADEVLKKWGEFFGQGELRLAETTAKGAAKAGKALLPKPKNVIGAIPKKPMINRLKEGAEDTFNVLNKAIKDPTTKANARMALGIATGEEIAEKANMGPLGTLSSGMIGGLTPDAVSAVKARMAGGAGGFLGLAALAFKPRRKNIDMDALMRLKIQGIQNAPVSSWVKGGINNRIENVAASSFIARDRADQVYGAVGKQLSQKFDQIIFNGNSRGSLFLNEHPEKLVSARGLRARVIQNPLPDIARRISSDAFDHSQAAVDAMSDYYVRVFDESKAMEGAIYNTVEGAMTDNLVDQGQLKRLGRQARRLRKEFVNETTGVRILEDGSIDYHPVSSALSADEKMAISTLNELNGFLGTRHMPTMVSEKQFMGQLKSLKRIVDHVSEGKKSNLLRGVLHSFTEEGDRLIASRYPDLIHPYQQAREMTTRRYELLTDNTFIKKLRQNPSDRDVSKMYSSTDYIGMRRAANYLNAPEGEALMRKVDRHLFTESMGTNAMIAQDASELGKLDAAKFDKFRKIIPHTEADIQIMMGNFIDDLPRFRARADQGEVLENIRGRLATDLISGDIPKDTIKRMYTREGANDVRQALNGVPYGDQLYSDLRAKAAWDTIANNAINPETGKINYSKLAKNFGDSELRGRMKHLVSKDQFESLDQLGKIGKGFIDGVDRFRNYSGTAIAKEDIGLIKQSIKAVGNILKGDPAEALADLGSVGLSVFYGKLIFNETVINEMRRLAEISLMPTNPRSAALFKRQATATALAIQQALGPENYRRLTEPGQDNGLGVYID